MSDISINISLNSLTLSDVIERLPDVIERLPDTKQVLINLIIILERNSTNIRKIFPIDDDDKFELIDCKEYISYDKEKKYYIINKILIAVLKGKIPVILTTGIDLTYDNNTIILKTIFKRVCDLDLNIILFIDYNIETLYERYDTELHKFTEHEEQELNNYYTYLEQLVQESCLDQIFLYKRYTDGIIYNFPEYITSLMASLTQPVIESYERITQLRFLAKSLELNKVIGHVTVSYNARGFMYRRSDIDDCCDVYIGILYNLKSTCGEYNIELIILKQINKHVDSGYAHITLNPGPHPASFMINVTKYILEGHEIHLYNAKTTQNIIYDIESVTHHTVELTSPFIIADLPR
jgi:hypothetical protein